MLISLTNRISFFAILMSVTLGQTNLGAQTIWSGPKIVFTKPDNADWTLPLHQDRITDSVWITRANTKGIFNIFKEPNYTNISPMNTEWAYGTTANIGSLIFDTWINTNGNNPTSMINKDAVIHLISENIYIDIKFISFSGGGTAGGFSYIRSTDQTLQTQEPDRVQNIKVFPNPCGDFLHVFGQIFPLKYSNANV